jgi:hypothetical protein
VRGFNQTAASLIEHWDGTAWRLVPAPDAGPLTGVVTLGPRDAWAVGSGGLLHYDGSAWTHAPAPPPGSYQALGATASGDVWLVGADAGGHSLIAHYPDHPAFADVPPSHPFYATTNWVACRAIVSGYTCGGPGEPCDPQNTPYFRPGAGVTRSQLLKMVVNAAGWPLVAPAETARTFADIRPGDPFYAFIETGAAHGVIGGYGCGGPDEPCDAQRRPYFRSSAPITRGQLSKVIALARHYPPPAGAQTFADVPPAAPFHAWIEALAGRGIVAGYTCGGAGEPCDAQHRAYFRPGASASRGQVTKFISRAFSAPPSRK